MDKFSPFAFEILKKRYFHPKETTWDEVAKRVAFTIMGDSPGSKYAEEVYQIIRDRKFMPGGRYLYATGHEFHQTQNCYDASTRVVTRHGTKTIEELAREGSATLMTTEGAWVSAEIKCFGEQKLYKVVISRSGVQKELFATEGHSWRIAKTTRANGTSMAKEARTTSELRAGDRLWSVFGYGISRTPVSPAGVQHGIVFGDGNVPKDEHGFNTAKVRLCGDKDRQLLRWFDGYPTRPIENDIEVSGLPRRYKNTPSLTEDRSYLLGWLVGYFAADGCVSSDGVVTLSSTNHKNLEHVKDVCYLLGIGAYGIRAVDRVSNLTGEPSTLYSVAFMRDTLTADFFLAVSHRERFLANPIERRKAWHVVSVEETDRVEPVYCAVVPETHEFVLEDNILTGNCLLLRAEDTREGWSELMQKTTSALMTGAGIGVVYSNLRSNGTPLRRIGGFSSGPLALMGMVNEAGRGIKQGGSRRAAIWAGLSWKHPDIFQFITCKNWSEDIRRIKETDFNFPAPMEFTNISVILDDEFFFAYKRKDHAYHQLAQDVYWKTVRNMLETAEPGFSIDTGPNAGEDLRNACTEITSRDDSDICNLGSINLARIESLPDMQRTTELATTFLLAGTLYSDVPYGKVQEVRTRNRRLGLGLMGLHEWLLLKSKKYGPDDELKLYLKEYEKSGLYANTKACEWGISRPVKTRAVAPTGTIGIVAETTTGVEPIYCAAYKRRYLDRDGRRAQYVLDPTAKRLAERGIDPDSIEDAYTLARDVRRRVEFQAWLQCYVDHAISSTINLPPWGSADNNESTVNKFGTIFMDFLPDLRGLTVYPDGARGGQPLTRVPWSEAVAQEGEIFSEDICDLKGGSCGS